MYFLSYSIGNFQNETGFEVLQFETLFPMGKVLKTLKMSTGTIASLQLTTALPVCM